MTQARKTALSRLPLFVRSVRPLAAVGLLIGAVTTTGCADDETVNPVPTTTGGSGGAAGSGGGKGGTAGKGGAGNGGTAGTAGTGGTAGKGGAGAGGGGTGGAGKGGGGAGGAGAGGAGAGGAGAGGAGAGGAGAGGTGMGGGGTGGQTLCGPATGDGKVTMKATVATGSMASFTTPFDATPSPDGCTVYFTAIDVATGNGAVYSVASTNGTAAVISSPATDGMIAPTGIAVSSDGKTLYVADPGAAEDAKTIGKDDGALFSLPSSGGAATILIKGSSPRSVFVNKEASGDVVYFGARNSDGSGAVFSTNGSSGGNAVLTGLVDPSGIAVTPDGQTIYVIDALGPGGKPALFSGTSGGTASLVIANLAVGYPSGLALSTAGTLVSSGLATGAAALFIDPNAKSVTGNFAFDAASIEVGGLHRAALAEVYAAAEPLAGGFGTITLLTP